MSFETVVFKRSCQRLSTSSDSHYLGLEMHR